MYPINQYVLPPGKYSFWGNPTAWEASGSEAALGSRELRVAPFSSREGLVAKPLNLNVDLSF